MRHILNSFFGTTNKGQVSLTSDAVIYNGHNMYKLLESGNRTKISDEK